MKNADKAFIQGYNAQACVDAKAHIIVAADLSNQAADTELLQEQVEQIKENTGRRPEELSAYAGYFSATNLEYLAQEGIEAYSRRTRSGTVNGGDKVPTRGRYPGMSHWRTRYV